ncbi:MAG: lytic transglycosylase domain-containing protein, partial [Fulvivirga sp.]
MKYLPHAISLLTLIVVCSYIQYNESKRGIEPTPANQAFYPKNIDLPPTEFQEYRNAISLQLPDTLTFAGERVPLNIPDVRERLDRELHINTYWHSSTIFLMKRANKWFPEMEKILRENGIPEDFKYLAAIEGGFMNEVSPANAVGFWQIRKDAAKENGLEIGNDVDERYDPIKSTEAACKYLNKAYKKFGNWTNVAASYNRGMSGLGRALDNQQ